MAESLASPPINKGAAHQEGEQSAEFLKVLSDLTTTQQTYSSQKKKNEGIKIVEAARRKLHQDSVSQLNKLKSGRESTSSNIQDLLVAAHEKIVEYNTRSDEFHLSVKARLAQHLEAHSAASAALNSLLTNLKEGLSQTSRKEMDDEINAIKEQLKAKMLQLEKRLYEIENQSPSHVN